jgi:hypothetical protein
MSEFTQIENDNPVITPAIDEKVFDKKWISHIRINSPTNTKAAVVAHLIPYNGSELLEGPIEQLFIPNIFEAMQDPNRPEELRTLMMHTMELILRTIKGETQWKASQLEENSENNEEASSEED